MDTSSNSSPESDPKSFARLIAIAGVLAERGISEIVLTDASGDPTRLKARQTDLPGEIMRRLAASSGQGAGGAGGTLRLDDGSPSPTLVVEFRVDRITTWSSEAALDAALKFAATNG